ncbi:MAG: hypothetical protein ACRD88_20790 [Terriglobia bacterium]
MSDRTDQYRVTYGRMADGELLELAGQVDQLTGEARTALWTELGRRGIKEEAIQARDSGTPQDIPAPPIELPEWGLFGPKPPELPPSELVTVFSAGDESEAEQVRELLRADGIESQMQIVILVRQAESEKALRILSEQLDPDAEPGDGPLPDTPSYP